MISTKKPKKKGRLNPFDATMVAQISPGEFKGVNHALLFAIDLVGKWLKKYKFKHWDVTEDRKMKVTEEMKEKRAKEIATKLTNHSTWRSHGRSIKIGDLEAIGLRITKVDADEKLKSIVYKIQTICWLLFNKTSAYKIYATDKEKIFKTAIPVVEAPRIPQKPQIPDVVEFGVKCAQCGKDIKVYAKLKDNPAIDTDFQQRGYLPFPKDNKLRCDCGYEIDLGGARNEIEMKTGMKVVD